MRLFTALALVAPRPTSLAPYTKLKGESCLKIRGTDGVSGSTAKMPARSFSTSGEIRNAVWGSGTESAAAEKVYAWAEIQFRALESDLA